MADLLRRQTNHVHHTHRFEHVGSKFMDRVVVFRHPFPFCAQRRIAVLPNGQFHFYSRVNAGRFRTHASFRASITLTIVPKDAFLSACKASDAFWVGERFLTARSSSSTPIGRPSSLMSSVSSTVTIACSSSAGAFVAVFDSGKLICTSGWSFLKVVETTKKIRRMVRISTSETIMIEGARRFRTAKFISSRRGR